MKLCRILLIPALAVSTGALPVLAQHGHDVGHMAGMHGDMGDARGTEMKNGGHASVNPDAVPNMLAKNTALEGRLRGLLPAGTNLQQAAMGFKTLGQFVAAVHVSHNLGMPFDQLKAKMTGPPPESLGKALHALDPNLDSKTVKSNVKTAEKQAKQDIEASESVPANDTH